MSNWQKEVLNYAMTQPCWLDIIIITDGLHLISMKLLNTYEDRDEAEKAETLITGEKRLASERDGTEVIYNLFGIPTWSNFYKLGMFNLPLLQIIIEQRKMNQSYDQSKHTEILSMLKYAASSFDLTIPKHWL
jgi:hypothetical protein